MISVVHGSRHVFEEEVSVTMPEHTDAQIVLAWKQIWQCGNAHVRQPDGAVKVVPYEVVVGITFDQEIRSAQAGFGTL